IRRHTRSKRDWSSDVCSSDLEDHRCDDTDYTDAEHRAVPADIIRHDPREYTAEYRTERIAADIESHGAGQAPRVDLFADIRHRNRRHTSQNHTLQCTEGDQHIEIRTERGQYA